MKKFETLVAEGDMHETEDLDDVSEDRKSGTEKENKAKNRRNKGILPKDNHKLFQKIKHIQIVLQKLSYSEKCDNAKLRSKWLGSRFSI